MQKDQVEERSDKDPVEDTSEQADANVEDAAEVEEKQEKPEEIGPEEKLQAELGEAKDKYLRLYSEFENFRRRTAKERIELIGTATIGLVENLLPVLDDFERAIKAMEEEKDATAREGTELIFNKFRKVLEAKGLKEMEVKKGDEFNDELHEAITQIPAEKDLEGKIVDVVEKGYFLSEKVVRFAKVVTGAKS